jgi:hypothetical protein
VNFSNIYKNKVLLIFTTITLFIPSCIPTNKTEYIDNIVTSDDNNNTIITAAPAEWNDYLINHPVYLYVELKSTMPVIINDHDVKIYESVNGKWVILKNNNNNPSQTFVIYPNEDDFMKRTIDPFVLPIFESRNNAATLRIVVYGNLYENNNKGEPVSATTDITLYP